MGKDFITTESTINILKQIIKMSYELEINCNKDKVKDTKQWQEFKRFRNRITDRFIVPIQKELDEWRSTNNIN